MGQVLKFPVRASKFGYKRVPKRSRNQDDPAQLHLFPEATAQILQLSSGLSPFDRALLSDECGDSAAMELYLKAISEHDRVADAYCNLGIIESKQGSTAKAVDCFTKCLEHNPRHFEAHYNLGNLYFEVNDLRLAQLHYEIASEIDPSFPNLHFNLALVLSMNNELAAAIKTLHKYRELAPLDERRNADDLLDNLTKSLAASPKTRKA